MAVQPFRSRNTPVVTLRGLKEGLLRLESSVPPVAPSPDKPPIDPVAQALMLNRYRRIIEEIEQETNNTGPDILVTVRSRDASLLQSKIAEEGETGRALKAGGLEAKFGTGPTGGDVWGWMKSYIDHVDREQACAIKRPASTDVELLPDMSRIAMLGDWGTNLYGAPVCAETILKTGPYDLLLHLGDVYYSGTKNEVKTRFLDVWPKTAGNKSRALNSNHEMYSGGFAYFEDMLPAFDQQSSYFALQNANWLLVGLDTAYVDHDMDATQVTWLQTVIRNAGTRKIVLFSHQQLFSRFDEQGPKLQTAITELLGAKAITAWYWGHEHECVLYDRHSTFGFFGRCLGHGGIPSPRKQEVKDAPSERTLDAVAWKRLLAMADCPACLVLDGRNPYIIGEEDRFGPHGYMTLELNGAKLTECVHLPDGTEIYKGQIS